jgi:hypothetical protein
LTARIAQQQVRLKPDNQAAAILLRVSRLSCAGIKRRGQAAGYPDYDRGSWRDSGWERAADQSVYPGDVQPLQPLRDDQCQTADPLQDLREQTVESGIRLMLTLMLYQPAFIQAT